MSDNSRAKDDDDSLEQKGRTSVDRLSLPTLEEAAIESHKKSFPELLKTMLNEETKAGGKAISWLPEGNGFLVSDQNKLEKQLIPKYFKEKCLFQSFVRKLYRWNFKQIDKSKISGKYVFITDKNLRRDSASDWTPLKTIRSAKKKNARSPDDTIEAPPAKTPAIGTNKPSKKSLITNQTGQGSIHNNDFPTSSDENLVKQVFGNMVASQNIVNQMSSPISDRLPSIVPNQNQVISQGNATRPPVSGESIMSLTSSQSGNIPSNSTNNQQLNLQNATNQNSSDGSSMATTESHISNNGGAYQFVAASTSQQTATAAVNPLIMEAQNSCYSQIQQLPLMEMMLQSRPRCGAIDNSPSPTNICLGHTPAQQIPPVGTTNPNEMLLTFLQNATLANNVSVANQSSPANVATYENMMRHFIQYQQQHTQSQLHHLSNAQIMAAPLALMFQNQFQSQTQFPNMPVAQPRNSIQQGYGRIQNSVVVAQRMDDMNAGDENTTTSPGTYVGNNQERKDDFKDE